MYVTTNYTVIMNFYHLGKGLVRRTTKSVIAESDTAFEALVGEMHKQTDRINNRENLSYTALASKLKLTGMVLRSDGWLTTYNVYPNKMIIF